MATQYIGTTHGIFGSFGTHSSPPKSGTSITLKGIIVVLLLLFLVAFDRSEVNTSTIERPKPAVEKRESAPKNRERSIQITADDKKTRKALLALALYEALRVHR